MGFPLSLIPLYLTATPALRLVTPLDMRCASHAFIFMACLVRERGLSGRLPFISLHNPRTGKRLFLLLNFCLAAAMGVEAPTSVPPEETAGGEAAAKSTSGQGEAGTSKQAAAPPAAQSAPQGTDIDAGVGVAASEGVPAVKEEEEEGGADAEKPARTKAGRGAKKGGKRGGKGGKRGKKGGK